MGYNKEKLLEQFIQEYIRLREPIGSEMLKNTLSLKASSATIRNHFKILMQEGILVQPHISGGRIPTHLAMKNYWRQRLNTKNSTLSITTNNHQLSEVCKEYGIFLLIKRKISQKLLEIRNIENQYLILIFEKGEIIIPYQPAMERFLNELISLDIQEIKKIAHQVMANSLLNKIDSLQQEEIQYFSLETLDFLITSPQYHALFFDILSGKIFEKIQNTIIFDPIMPEGYMGLVHNILQQEKESKMLCIGYLTSDYQSFYEQIAA